MPFTIAAIACSRTPKWRLRPEKSFGVTAEEFFIVFLVDPVRSAEPPTSAGTRSASALIAAPDRLRVASLPLSASAVTTCW